MTVFLEKHTYAKFLQKVGLENVIPPEFICAFQRNPTFAFFYQEMSVVPTTADGTTHFQVQIPGYDSITIDVNSQEEMHSVIRNAVLNIQNLQLRIYFSWLQGCAIVAALFAVIAGAYETTKVLVAVNFALGFLGILLFNIGVDLTQISHHILVLIAFSIIGIVAYANHSRIGLYLSLISLCFLFVLIIGFIFMKNLRRNNHRISNDDAP